MPESASSPGGYFHDSSSCCRTTRWLALAQNVIHYTTTIDYVKYLFATAESVARLHSDDILDTNTLDCLGNVLNKPGDKLSMVKGDNPLAGPFYVAEVL